MGGILNNDLMGPDPVHLVKKADAGLVQVPFDLQGRKLIRHDPETPPGGIRKGPGFTVGQYLGRCKPLIPRTKRTKAAFSLRRCLLEIRRPPSPFRRDNHPPSSYRIFS